MSGSKSIAKIFIFCLFWNCILFQTIQEDADFETDLYPEEFEDAKFEPIIDQSDELFLDITDSQLKSYNISKFEGDITNPEDFKQLETFMEDVNKGDYSNLFGPAEANRYQLWQKHEIPFKVSSRYPSKGRRRLAAALSKIMEATCLRFIARNPSLHPDYVYFSPKGGCFSGIGREGGRQLISLEKFCMKDLNIIWHQIVHALGLFHEHNRIDRGDHLSVDFFNLKLDALKHFLSFPVKLIDDLQLPYDFQSVTHFDGFEFSRNGKQILIPRNGRQISKNGLSPLDLERLNELYHCGEERTSRAPRSWFFQCADGHRLPRRLRCDSFPDCDDGTDEINC